MRTAREKVNISEINSRIGPANQTERFGLANPAGGVGSRIKKQKDYQTVCSDQLRPPARGTLLEAPKKCTKAGLVVRVPKSSKFALESSRTKKLGDRATFCEVELQKGR